MWGLFVRDLYVWGLAVVEESELLVAEITQVDGKLVIVANTIDTDGAFFLLDL
jgi:hypothetical protein